MTTSGAYRAQLSTVRGWFAPGDYDLFTRVLDGQAAAGTAGDLVEIGVFEGKSMILIGCYATATSRAHACDTFGAVADALAGENNEENERSYAGLSELTFLANYARFHAEPPVVHVMPSVRLGEHVPAGTVRFLHLDGSHTHAVVEQDIVLGERLLTADGVIVLDDFRGPHTPGVAAATWAAVASGRLIPVALTEQKFYGAFTPAGAEAARTMIGTQPPEGQGLIVEEIAGTPVRIFLPAASGRPMGVAEAGRRAGADLRLLLHDFRKSRA